MTKEKSSAAQTLSASVLTDVLASAMDAIITIDEQQRILLFNAAAEEIFGYPAADVIGMQLETLLPARHRDAHKLHIENFNHHGATRRRMGRLGKVFGLRRSGEEFPIEASISCSAGAQGRLFTVILRDVSEREKVAEMLHSTTALMASIVESSDDAIIGKTLDGTIISWNKGAERLFGYTAAEAIGQSMMLIIPAERAAEEPAILRRVARGERISHFETERVRKDGARIEISVTISPLRDATGRIVGASKIARDVTERKVAQQKILRLSRIHAVLSGLNALIVRTRDRQVLFDGICRIAVEQGGFGAAWIGLIEMPSADIRVSSWVGPDQERLGRTVAAVRSRILRGRGLISRAIQARAPVFTQDVALDPSETIAQHLTVPLEFDYRALVALPVIVDGNVVGAMELFLKEHGKVDPEELALLNEIGGDLSYALRAIEQEDKLEFLAYHDALTGLANRTLIQDRLEQALRSARATNAKVALLIADLKGFRRINATMTRDAGDTLLREVAFRLRSMLPEPENVARIAADYFAAVFSNIRSASEVAHIFEEATRGPLGKTFEIGRQELHVTMRAGIAVYPDDGPDAETIFKNAEAAHKRSKVTGDPYTFYQSEMNARVSDSLLLESRLRSAVERRQFQLNYQPKVDAVSGRVTGAEALLRWQDSERGPVSPGVFIPVLEENGMINEIGMWAIRQALADHRKWETEGRGAPPVAVNVSSIQLKRPDFVPSLRRELEAFAPMCLELEITESVMMENIEQNLATLREIRQMGVSVSIDDFGTGYSSLNYLTRLPVTALKIDLSFVTTMASDPNSAVVVAAIISLAHSLRLKVIAEGVETEEQASMLRSLGCDQLQGYLFSKPVSAALFAERLERNADPTTRLCG